MRGRQNLDDGKGQVQAEIELNGFNLNARAERLDEPLDVDAFRIKPVGLKRWVKQ